MKFDHNIGAEDSKNYLKLKGGDSVVGVFVGEPYGFNQHWPKGGKRTICIGASSGCPECKAGLPVSFRFKVNFITKDPSGALMARIWEQGTTVYRALRDLNEDYKLEDHFMKITRSGNGQQDTSYSILPIRGGEINEEQRKKIASVRLINLNQQEQPQHEETPLPEEPAHLMNPHYEDDLPF